MGALTGHDAAQILESVHELYRETDVRSLPRAIVDLLAKLVPGDAAGFNIVHSDLRVETEHNAPSLVNVVNERLWALQLYGSQHPLEIFEKQSSKPEALRISDFLTRRKFHASPLYQEFYRHIEVEHQLAIYLRQPGKYRIALTINSNGRDFSERDREVLRHAAPHVLQAYQNAGEFTQLKCRTQTVERGASAHRQGFIYLNPDCSVADMTSLCSDWLATYCKDYRRSTTGLPESLRSWIKEQQNTAALVNSVRKPLSLIANNCRLTVRLAFDGAQLVLLLSEQELASSPEQLAPLGLGKREAEVLFWMAQGKTNPEIATILGISPRTIHKHNENLFRKLGVEGRHAAVLMALELLGKS